MNAVAIPGSPRKQWNTVTELRENNTNKIVASNGVQENIYG